jgi:hypothetical protein
VGGSYHDNNKPSESIIGNFSGMSLQCSDTSLSCVHACCIHMHYRQTPAVLLGELKHCFSYTNMFEFVGFEVLKAVVIKSTIVWDITPCSPLKVNRSFGVTYRLHLQGRRISQERNQMASRALLATWFHAGFLHSLFFDPEDRGAMFLRNVGWISTNYTELYPRS